MVDNKWPQGPGKATLTPGPLDDFWQLRPSLHIAIDLVDDGWFYIDMEARGLRGMDRAALHHTAMDGT